jgi:hypothetical protein
MRAPELNASWTKQGLDPVGKPAAEFAAHLRQQSEQYGQVIRDASIKAERAGKSSCFASLATARQSQAVACASLASPLTRALGT